MGSGEIPAPESCLVAPRGMGYYRGWRAAEAPQQVPGTATLLGISPYPRPIMNRRTRSWRAFRRGAGLGSKDSSGRYGLVNVLRRRREYVMLPSSEPHGTKAMAAP